MDLLGIVAVLGGLALAVWRWRAADAQDRRRIDAAVALRQGRIDEVTRVWNWNRYGGRHYEVVYVDAEGRQHMARAVISWTGFRWTKDVAGLEPPKPVATAAPLPSPSPSQPSDDPFGEKDFLRRENARLRAEAEAAGLASAGVSPPAAGPEGEADALRADNLRLRDALAARLAPPSRHTPAPPATSAPRDAPRSRDYEPRRHP